MSFDEAVSAMAGEALAIVRDGQTIGLGSGRAATAFVLSLAELTKSGKLNVKCVPTSLQIKMVAERNGIDTMPADQTDHIDAVFDGADQLNADRLVIKGGGGALLLENIIMSMSERAVIMADESKFVEKFDIPVPAEVHPMARLAASKKIRGLGGVPNIRTIGRGYPFITENGNIILDCDFGVIEEPMQLRRSMLSVPGIMEFGIFQRVPDTIYRAGAGGTFSVERR